MWKNSPVKVIQNEKKINIESDYQLNNINISNKIVFPSQSDYQNILKQVSNSLFDDDNDHNSSINTETNYENNENNENHEKNNNDSINSFQSITTYEEEEQEEEEENLPEFIGMEENISINLPKFEPPPYLPHEKNNEQNIDQMISSIPQNSIHYPSLDTFTQYLSLIEESYPTKFQDQIYPNALTADILASQIKKKVSNIIIYLLSLIIYLFCIILARTIYSTWNL